MNVFRKIWVITACFVAAWLAPSATRADAACTMVVLRDSLRADAWTMVQVSAEGLVSPIEILSQDSYNSLMLVPNPDASAQQVAYASNASGNWDIWLWGLAQSAPRQLTFGESLEMNPVWSPDGTQLAYESNANGNWDIWLSNPNTGASQALTSEPSAEIKAVWSPDGTQLAFISDRSGTLQAYLYTVADGSVRRISSQDTVAYQEALFAPDGSQVLLRGESTDASGVKQSVLYLVALATGAELALSPLGADSRGAAWSPDSLSLAYQSSSGGALPAIYRYTLSTQSTQHLLGGDISATSPAWDCQSRLLAYTSDAAGNHAIQVVELGQVDVAPRWVASFTLPRLEPARRG